MAKSRPLKTSREEVLVVERGVEIEREVDPDKETVFTTTTLVAEELTKGIEKVKDRIFPPQPKVSPSFSLSDIYSVIRILPRL